MHDVLANLHLFILTPWKIIGLLGTLLFTARWFVQFYATKKNKKVTVPMSFWYLSLSGSVFTLAYFIWGKNDSVGILSNLFPAGVAGYNLVLDLRHKKAQQEERG